MSDNANQSTPRALPSDLGYYAAHPRIHKIRLVGIVKVTGVDNIIMDCGEGELHAVVTMDQPVLVDHMYEVVGRVIRAEGSDGYSLQVERLTEWPKNQHGQLPDLKLAVQLAKMTRQFPQLF